jgi:hypothetical protein
MRIRRWWLNDGLDTSLRSYSTDVQQEIQNPCLKFAGLDTTSYTVYNVYQSSQAFLVGQGCS